MKLPFYPYALKCKKIKLMVAKWDVNSSTSPSTMRVVACINGKKAIVFIDTGSSTSPSIIRVIACINGKKAVVLIDTGSTHNLLDSNLAKSMKLVIDSTSCFGMNYIAFFP